jgi:hypothetical protein
MHENYQLIGKNVASSLFPVPDLAVVKEKIKSIKFGKDPRFKNKNNSPTKDVGYYISHQDEINLNELYDHNWMGKSKRFKNPIESEVPGPGLYSIPGFTDKFKLIIERNRLRESHDGVEGLGESKGENDSETLVKNKFLKKSSISGKTTKIPSRNESINVSIIEKKKL